MFKYNNFFLYFSELHTLLNNNSPEINTSLFDSEQFQAIGIQEDDEATRDVVKCEFEVASFKPVSIFVLHFIYTYNYPIIKQN